MSKSPSLRRIQADIRELTLDPSDRYFAAPLENDMFEWHFTIRGADGTDFEGGIYHGRILLPPEYPFKPPNIVFLTPSGRFETNTKVCLSFSAYHPELWQPAWGIRLILEALISFLPTPADGAIGALDWSSEERKRLAVKSRSFYCNRCGQCVDLLPKLDPDKKKNTSGSQRFSKEIEELQRLQQLTEGRSMKGAAGQGDEVILSEGNGSVELPNVEERSKAVDTMEEQNIGDSASSLNAILWDQTNDDEEIVFERIAVERETVDGSTFVEESSAQEISSTTSPTNFYQESPADVSPEGTTETENNGANHHSSVQMPNPSWMYDPLLNLMIAILAALCYMLWQKFIALQLELSDLRAQTLMME